MDESDDDMGVVENSGINPESMPDNYELMSLATAANYGNTPQFYNRLTFEQKLEVKAYVNQIKGLDASSFENEEQ